MPLQSMTTERLEADNPATSATEALSLIHSINSADSMKSVGIAIVNRLRKIFQADQVAFVEVDQASEPDKESKVRSKVIAVSDIEKADAANPFIRAIHAAAMGAAQGKQPVIVTRGEQPCGTARKLAEPWLRTGGFEACTAIPLLDKNDNAIGVILIASKAKQLGQQEFLGHALAVCNLIAGQLGMVARANRTLMQQVRENLGSFFRNRKTKIASLAAVALLGIMAVPSRTRIACDCEVEPVTRRFVNSPYDGVLEKTLVKTGDPVAQDELLALMDGRAIRIELAGIQADFEAARKRRDSALALGEVAKSQIARSEMERHESRIELLNNRLQQLEIRSPIAGIVVTGDLENVVGARLEKGQTMFEIGPLDRMLGNVHIPESEIRLVKPGMRVGIKLTAWPHRKFFGQVAKVHPRAEIIDDRNVFVAEVRLDNEDQQLQPGMRGRAVVKSDFAPLGWNLFHRAWDKARFWMTW